MFTADAEQFPNFVRPKGTVPYALQVLGAGRTVPTGTGTVLRTSRARPRKNEQRRCIGLKALRITNYELRYITSTRGNTTSNMS